MRFFVPTDLRIEPNAVSASADVIGALGSRCLVLTGAVSAKKCGALSDVCAVLDDMQIEYRVYDRIRQNPTVDMCVEAGMFASQIHAQYIVGIGGGSVLDAAKAAAVFAANPTLTEDALYAYEWSRAPLPTVDGRYRQRSDERCRADRFRRTQAQHPRRSALPRAVAGRSAIPFLARAGIYTLVRGGRCGALHRKLF